MLRVLFVGDVYGKPGRRVLAAELPRLRAQADFVIVNGENAAGGFGLNREAFELMLNAGAGAVTLGNHAWHHKDVYSLLDHPQLVRPLNLPPGTPGQGWRTFEVGGQRLTVVNALGRVFMDAAHNPFLALDDLLQRPDLGSVFVDFHAEATSEKAALGWYLDGRVAAVIGTHTHVPTADSRILPRGTAFQTDAGFTGPLHSIIGADPEGPLQKFVTERPHRFGVKEGPAELNGVWLDIEHNAALRIERYHFEEART
ncbi:TIGR00282 family metallophosphoesterase [Deinococcus irradiatisoli]|uniref:TIGR00282 family metallophosphoesterase n=1 Tax=Deinococcus irradiatisoli TaxID=2202254 RepID=A0A2Z3JPL7_9DEIO|nr:TIGR00282 family metallophosphoesterase [Deinococcus irradiatisoli]AWN23438.1 TIGR00282 family metallophosphoesterase [Deinococcus irradiatisoli]